MQSGIDTSRARIAAELPVQEQAEAYPTQTAAAASVTKPVAADSASVGSGKGFFGPQGPTFRDALDAINPLNHIPIVSDILANVTGHEPSTASKLAGGALFGPIGFASSLASVIFEDVGGKTPANAVYAAITGESTTQVARTDTQTSTQMAKVDTAVEPVDATELASLETAGGSTEDAIADANTQADAALAATPGSMKGNAVLDLYGASNDTAHASYKKAQLLPYLRDVNHSSVM
jgi:hypothetical protein